MTLDELLAAGVAVHERPRKGRPAGAVLVAVHVQPGAARTEPAGLHGDRLKVRLTAPPVDGKANKALIAWAAGHFGVAKGSVELVRGASSRQKTLRVVVS